MDLLTILLALLAVAVVWLCFHMTRFRGYLETLPYPVEKPFLVFGSEPRAIHKFNYPLYYMERFKALKTYTFTRYDGVFPTILTIDPELVKSVTVKNFDCFTDYLSLPHVKDSHITLDISSGEKWRALRKNMSPTFSSGKLRAMLAPMSGVVKNLMEHLDEKVKESDGEVFDMKAPFQGFSVDTIGATAFGIDINYFKNPDQDLVKHGKAILGDFVATNWMETLLFSLPFSYFPVIFKLLGVWPASYDKLWKITDDIVKQREEEKVTNRGDFLSRLVELRKIVREEPDSEITKHLNNDIITAQGAIFFLAGYETTANALTTFSYNLAKNPEVQENVFREISDVVENFDGQINDESIAEMKYLEAAINEDLRVMPPATAQVRVCTKDCEIAPGVFFKKGMRVEIPIYASHHNPEFFPEPDKFMPERFLKENAESIIPYTHRPFGGGPRNCIGARFAMISMKMVMANLILKYRLVATQDTKIENRKGETFLFGFNDMKLKLERRVEE